MPEPKEEKKEEPKEEKKDKGVVKEKYQVGSVVTETAPTVLIDGEPKTTEQILVEILNKLDKIEKSV